MTEDSHAAVAAYYDLNPNVPNGTLLTQIECPVPTPPSANSGAAPGGFWWRWRHAFDSRSALTRQKRSDEHRSLQLCVPSAIMARGRGEAASAAPSVLRGRCRFTPG